jgi:hypothetical protein
VQDFWLGRLKGRYRSEDLGADWRIMLQKLFGRWGVGVWIGFTWLKIGTGDGRLCAR